MTNERATRQDVRWLDEMALHAAVVGGDQEAFAELMWRYDPLVRYKIWRVLGRLVAAETLDAQIAELWCALMADDWAILRGWDADTSNLFAGWLGGVAVRVSGEWLRRRLRERAAA